MKKQKYSVKTKLKRTKGITLIALVITIIVLLILAGVTISTLTGENGILTKASESELETRGAAVEEARDLWMTEKNMDNETGESTAKSLEELISELLTQNLLTEDEKDIILGNEEKGIEAQYQITIGSHFIDFTTNGTEIDYANLAPGLYETGTTNMIKSWEQLKEDGEISIRNDSTTSFEDELNMVHCSKGDLVIAEGITSISVLCFNGHCGGNTNITGLVLPSTIDKYVPCENNTGIENVYIKDGFSGSISVAGCTNLKSIRLPNKPLNINCKNCTSLTDVKCKTYVWLSLDIPEEGNESLINAYMQSYRSYAEKILNNLPTDETERNASIDRLFIDAYNYLATYLMGKPEDIVLETLQDVWDAMGNGYTYSSVQEYYQAQESNNYSSCEEMLINQIFVDPKGFDEQN